jgi:hypothetical protein
MPSTDQFRAELIAQIDRAAKQGRPHVEINAGELRRKVGGYPAKADKHHAMPTCSPEGAQRIRDYLSLNRGGNRASSFAG